MDKIELPVLDIQGLDIRLPQGADRPLAVQGASLQLLPGQTLCVVGESGSGKSMIANAIMGLLPRPHVEPVAGRILFDGHDLLQLSETQLRALRGRRMGMVFQEPMTALNPVMRIGEQIAEVFDAHVSLPAAEKRQRILAALADVGLPEPEVLIDSYPFRLSGGQRQRVMIACALVLEPALLICDEPTTALDVTTQAQILKLIRELQQRKGTAVLFITHDFGVVSEIADQVVVMQTGQVVEAGPAATVLARPQHAYTRKLIAAIPDGRVRQPSGQRAIEHVLQVQDLRKTYVTGGSLFRKGRRVEAAKGLSFDLRLGETLGLVGESGSGKSTVGRCIVGLAPFDSGRILFRGRTLQSGEQFRQQTQGKIQMVFQDPYASLNPRHRIGAAIAQGPIAQGLPKDKAMARAMELLELVGLKADAADRFPHEFSGGQRQRIGIARALAMEPHLLVADEPVSALDVSVQAQVLKLFAEVRERFQLAMVFITHDLRVAGEMCDHIAVMQRGEIVEYGETAKVLADPRHAYTRTLIEAQPRLSAAAEVARTCA
ncbi:ABC transporter ATP-binding protein [Acidovorax sp. NCPPB 3859]|nr:MULTISPECIES: ABC transporter ATP-binding protein [unclassified Acidovorax]MDA8450515.1 ABC transporter ATP-binding protein [Acidovorax sp. GBBC 3297]MDA8459811.1 ABC transporter ATP-binding protein [Acidovorax sp. GBBC 3333]MDA8464847.1 ABC transporter ATP-binding protein [Acidovorax sp. GBBC 3332]MDA8470030.1 ABC transporter ATP-binding protein [Acidovorax sp. GBBC 3299]WCM77377.1 ABC transporter ATP-binding protein [Acidovorax sp. GBBC 712]